MCKCVTAPDWPVRARVNVPSGLLIGGCLLQHGHMAERLVLAGAAVVPRGPGLGRPPGPRRPGLRQDVGPVGVRAHRALLPPRPAGLREVGASGVPRPPPPVPVSARLSLFGCFSPPPPPSVIPFILTTVCCQLLGTHHFNCCDSLLCR